MESKEEGTLSDDAMLTLEATAAFESARNFLKRAEFHRFLISFSLTMGQIDISRSYNMEKKTQTCDHEAAMKFESNDCREFRGGI